MFIKSFMRNWNFCFLTVLSLVFLNVAFLSFSNKNFHKIFYKFILHNNHEILRKSNIGLGKRGKKRILKVRDNEKYSPLYVNMTWSPEWFANRIHVHIVNCSSFGIECLYCMVPSASKAYLSTLHESCEQSGKMASNQSISFF